MRLAATKTDSGPARSRPTTITMGADEPSLPKLLASLALGARAVNALPLSRENNDAQEEDDGDEFSFHMSLPEFASLNNEARQSLSSLLSQALEGISTDEDDAMDGAEDYEFDDPELWTKVREALVSPQNCNMRT